MDFADYSIQASKRRRSNTPPLIQETLDILNCATESESLEDSCKLAMAPTDEEWFNVKDKIEDLYVSKGHTLRYVADVLKHRHRSDATSRMFKSRIKAWNYDRKTIREPEWRFMLQEYNSRKKPSPPKEIIFRVCQGNVTKYKTITHIRAYMRRKQVSKDDFLRSLSTNTNCPHIQSITPPLSPALSSVSPANQVDCHNADEKQRKYNRQTEHRFENSLAEFYLPQPHSQSGYRSIL